jgi:phospholipid-binding lipoprotein MlaA
MNVTYRTLRQYALILVAAFTLGACSTAPIQKGAVVEQPYFSPEDVLVPGTTYLSEEQIPDPWEGFNRTMYRFNYHFDHYVFLPAVRVYKAVLPDIAQDGLHNFFNNVHEITTLINSALQLSADKTFITTGRLMVNTTVGLLGLIDVASTIDLPRQEEDFGQTLGHWGVGTGPYLVLPLYGPSNVRDAGGIVADVAMMSAIDPLDLQAATWREITYDTLYAVDTRAHVPFRYYETGSPFEYEFVRMLYTTKRQLEIEK